MDVKMLTRMYIYSGIILLLYLIPKCQGTPCGQYFTSASPEERRLVASDNFPLNHNNLKNCHHTQYRIYLDQNSSDPETSVCFVFKRFSTQMDCLHVNDTLYERVYCDKGSQREGPVDYWSNIWAPSLCFSPLGTDDFVALTYTMLYRTSGFLATWSVKTASQMSSFIDKQVEKKSAKERNAKQIIEETTDGNEAWECVPPEDLGCDEYCYFGSHPDEDGCPTCNCSDVGIAPCGEERWPCFSDKRCVTIGSCADSQCLDQSDITYAHARCKERVGYGFGDFACDFEDYANARCTMYDYGFERDYQSFDPENGPSHDHTTEEGYYLRTNFNTASTAQLTHMTVGFYRYGYVCLSFYYHMHGPDPGRLFVSLSGKSGYPDWSRQGNLGNIWQHGIIEKEILISYPRIEFEAKVGSEVRGQIAIDDISIIDGRCPSFDDVSCNFEYDMCSWTSHDGHFRRHDYTSGPGFPDYTSMEKDGYYIAMETSAIVASIESPYITRIAEYCFVVWFLAQEPGNFELALLRQRHGQTYPNMIESHFEYSNPDWQQVKFTITSYDKIPFKLILKATKSWSEMEVALDGIMLIQGNCFNLDIGSCQPGSFRCRGLSHKCIPEIERCDGKPQCEDHSDELYCCESQSDMFTCDDGTCIQEFYRCDGEKNCADGSDEIGCSSNGTVITYSFPLAAIVSISVAALLIISLVSIKIISYYYYQRGQTMRTSGGNSRSAENGVQNEAYQPPPEYSECVTTSAQQIDLVPVTEAAATKEELPPPAYEIVQKESYIQITRPVTDELERLRHEMAQIHSSNETSAVPSSPTSLPDSRLRNGGNVNQAFIGDDDDVFNETNPEIIGNNEFSNQLNVDRNAELRRRISSELDT